MIEPCRDPDLPQEALGAEGRRQRRAQNFHGDLALVPQIAGTVDGGHTAAPDLALDLIARSQGALDLNEQVHQ